MANAHARRRSDRLLRGLNAAQSVLDAAGVSPFDAAYAEFKLEGWDDADFSDDMQPTESEMHAHRALSAASNAAHEGIDSQSGP